VDAALVDLHQSHAGGEGACWQTSVADHLAMPLLVDRIHMRFQPVLNFSLDRLAQQTLCSITQNLGQNIP